MKKARISELRDRLSRYLDHVRAGGRVLVLDRNRPVAEIVPVGTDEAGTDEDRLATLEREGLVRRGAGRVPAELLRAPSGGEAGVLAALLRERESGRGGSGTARPWYL
jgi:prevent-host-death family protein